MSGNVTLDGRDVAEEDVRERIDLRLIFGAACDDDGCAIPDDRLDNANG